MLTGILHPTSGTVRVHGLDPIHDRSANARQMGVVFGQRTQLWWDLPVADSLEMLRRIYDIPADRFRRNLKRFDEVLGLDELLKVPVRRLSLGQRVRCDIAAALLHDPRVVYLDEPTVGVDVSARQRIREFIRTINRDQKVTVLLTTHEMSDVERLCERIIVVDRGRIQYDGSLDRLRQRLGRVRELVVDFAEPVRELSLPPGASVAKVEGWRAWIEFERDRLTAPRLISTLQAQRDVEDLTLREPEIEQVIHRLYEEGRVPEEVAAS
jgi:ABC-2 type transport system ATP-binding protein